MVISGGLRDLVARRAGYQCEYCLLHEDDSYSPHQVDHIISKKHGGLWSADNLAWCCLRCNLWKGSDVGSLDATTGSLTRLFHPRRDLWSDHFRFDHAVIEPITPEGEVTARLLRLNISSRVAERSLLIALGRYQIPR